MTTVSRELVAYTLHSAGFEAEGFERPSAFWRACAERRPDLVLLDLMLPEEDGISILKKLRQAPETARAADFASDGKEQ